MHNNKITYWFATVGLFLLLSQTGKAQVSIGAEKKPESFSVLQLEGTTGGLRLNNLTTTQRNALSLGTNNALAKGLTIYNTTTNQVEVWNGSAWIVATSYSVGNGLTLATRTIDLGGSLTKATLFTLGAYSVNFSQSTSTTYGSVGIGTSTSVPPDKSSILELRSTNKGLLLPRVSLSSTTSTTSPISSPVKGLLVYNIATATGLSANNLYTWNGSKWNKIVDDSNLSASVSSIGVPRSAVFQLTSNQTNFLNGVGAGSKQNVPMSQVVNNLTDYISFNSSTNSITFTTGGIYTVIFIYEGYHDASGCNIASYIVDFPSGSGTTRIHSTAAFNGGVLSNHGGTITYTGRISNGKVWKIELGRGQSGNCSGTGLTLGAYSTHVSVTRLGD